MVSKKMRLLLQVPVHTAVAAVAEASSAVSAAKKGAATEVVLYQKVSIGTGTRGHQPLVTGITRSDLQSNLGQLCTDSACPWQRHYWAEPDRWLRNRMQ